MTAEYLDSKREEIAAFDRKILYLLKERLDLAMDIGRYKAEHGLEVVNKSVEQKVINRYRSIAEEIGLDQEYAERLARIVIAESVSKEEQFQKHTC